ncbi:androglobin isoform X1, partial [Silurus meridionalis]
GEAWRSCENIWPEWNEAEVSAEKWEAAKGAKDAKARKSPVNQYFEDPEGKVKIPASLNVHTWKRPMEHIVQKTPVVVQNESCDLMSANEHLMSSELMRRIISEIYIVWEVCSRQSSEGNSTSEEATASPWRPWEHIYSLCKAVKGHIPLFNAYGKYVVRLYWMGCWRKITIDDWLPFDEKNNLLLPASANQSELWPMLLTKGILKLASTEMVQDTSREIEEFSVIHCLTGWIPEFLPIKPRSRYVTEIWGYLKDTIPKFQPTEESAEEGRPSIDLTATGDSPKEANKEKERGSGPPPAPRIIVCASFHPFNLQEKKTSMLGQMADASQTLRQNGLCQLYSHTILLTRTRDCPLVAVPPLAPYSKCIRTQKETDITDEPKKIPVERPEQYVAVASPFINYKLTPLIIDSNMPPKLLVQRRNTSTSNLDSFSESEENEDRDSAHHDVTNNNHKSDDSEVRRPASIPTNPECASKPCCLLLLSLSDADSVPGKETTLVQENFTFTETWIHMEDFIKCFQMLLVFHMESSFTYQYQKSEYKVSHNPVEHLPRRSELVIGVNGASSYIHYCISSSHFKAQDENRCYFLTVDNLWPTEILICYSALLHWGDTSHERKDCVLRPGHLCVEPFSWKDIQVHPPLLTINTTSCKASVLTLPPGRHVLRIQTRVHVCFHMQLYSKTDFVFGEEEAVIPHLEKESLRFCEQARLILTALGSKVRSFSNPDELPAATGALQETVCPPSLSKTEAKDLWRVFIQAVYHMFGCALGRKLTSEELFAVKSLTIDLTPHSRNAKDANGVPEGWSGRQTTEEENQAATILQASWKGYLVRKVLNAAKPGSEENQKVAKTLLEMWASVESDVEEHAVSLLRCMIANGEKLVNLYPCGGDEWTKISFTDFSVPVHETTSSWVLLFREVFHVPKAVLLVPKIFSTFRSHLHVIDNDTGKEVPEFLNSVLPFTYTPNKAGYTFVAHNGKTPVVPGTWRLRLISSREQPAQLARERPVNNFIVKEFKDYYLPNKKNIICRHAVTVTCDHVATVQFQASKDDVYLKLSILDHETEVYSKTGQGGIVIPVYRFIASEGSCGSAVEKAGVSQSQDGPGGGHDGGREASECQPAQTHHKYILQAELLYNSWPLDDSLSGFIQTLRDKESNEMRVFKHLIKDAADQLSSEPQKPQMPTSKTSKSKEKDKTTPKEVQQMLDETKPHWTLHVVSEQTEAEQIQVKKDTERLEQIRAIKQAWEASEPGRAAKAFQTRQQYLDHLRTIGEDFRLDLTPFIRKTGRPERLKDAAMKEEQQREQLEKVQSFRLYRETVLDHRRQEQEQTRQLIKEQLELFERIQQEKAELLRRFDRTREIIQTWKLDERSQKRGKESKRTDEESQKGEDVPVN